MKGELVLRTVKSPPALTKKTKEKKTHETNIKDLVSKLDVEKNKSVKIE